MIFVRIIDGKAKKHKGIIQVCGDSEVISTCVLRLHQPFFFFSSDFLPAPFSPSDRALTVCIEQVYVSGAR